MAYNFKKKVYGSEVVDYGVPYDYASIMHYPWTAFSKNGKKTLEPIRPLNGKTPYVKLSDDDALQARRMYKCSGEKIGNRPMYRNPANFCFWNPRSWDQGIRIPTNSWVRNASSASGQIWQLLPRFFIIILHLHVAFRFASCKWSYWFLTAKIAEYCLI